MINNIKNWLHKNSLYSNKKISPILNHNSRDIMTTSFHQSEDEQIVINFLNNIDQEFPSTESGRLQQGNSFEIFLAAVFRIAGYDVVITEKTKNKKTGDDNIDLIITKNHQKIAVQAKHFRLNTKAPKLITKDDIVKYSGISDEGWSNKLFITTGLFNSYVYEEISKNEKAQKIEWYDRYGLLQLLNSIIPHTMEKQIFLKSLPEQIKKCPKCASGFIITKWSSKTKMYFKACTMYPTCTYTEKINFN